MRRAKGQLSYRRGRQRPFGWVAVVCISLVLLRVALWVLLKGAYAFFGSGRSRDAKIAFFIQVSEASALQTPRLLTALWHKENIYAVHFDTKMSLPMRTRMERLLLQHEQFAHGNVFVLKSEPVSYAGITMVLNTINAMSQLLKSSRDWDFFVNLSGSDYPLTSPLTLRRLLGNAGILGKRLNFVQNQSADKDMDWFFNRRMASVHIDTSLWARRGINRQVGLSEGSLEALNVSHPVEHEYMPLVKTEGWMILHRSFAEHVVDSAESRRLLLSFATARAADELFFGTLLAGSDRFSETIVWDALRFIFWGSSDKHLPRPAFLDQEANFQDLRAQMSSSGALFARKFLNLESEIVAYIEANMSGIADFDYLIQEEAVEMHTARVRHRLLCVAELRQQSECLPGR